MHVNAVH